MKKLVLFSAMLAFSSLTFSQTKGTKSTPSKSKTSTTKSTSTSKTTSAKSTTTKPPVEKIKVEYTIASGYFKRNDQPNFGKQRTFDSKGILEQNYGYAATMGENGQPTSIDFSKQFVIALQEADSTLKGEIIIKSIIKTGSNLDVTYSVKYGENLGYTATNFVLLIIDKKYNGKINYHRTLEVPTLKISPLKNSGSLGQVTFSTKESTWFYYNQTSKSGEITLDGKTYTLTDYKFINNQGNKGKKDGYELSGNGVTITAPNFTPSNANAGGDCIYGKIPFVTITLNGVKLVLKNVEVQDCPNY